MLRQHIYRHTFASPRHQPGEVVTAFVQTYDHKTHGFCPKLRPVILILCGQSQHWFAGITTRPRCPETGIARPALPAAACLGLDKPSFLWTSPDDHVSRLDVREHIGWVDPQSVELLAKTLPLDATTVGVLRRAAAIHGDDAGSPPRKPR